MRSRWLAYSQPYRESVIQRRPEVRMREWLPYRVRLADDVTQKLLRRMWTRKRGKR